MTLEILDAKNNVMRRYSSTDKPELTQEEMEKQLIPLHWLRKPTALPGFGGDASLGVGPALHHADGDAL